MKCISDYNLAFLKFRLFFHKYSTKAYKMVQKHIGRIYYGNQPAFCLCKHFKKERILFIKQSDTLKYFVLGWTSFWFYTSFSSKMVKSFSKICSFGWTLPLTVGSRFHHVMAEVIGPPKEWFNVSQYFYQSTIASTSLVTYSKTYTKQHSLRRFSGSSA